MFRSVLGLLGQDLAVDLGTSNTRLYLRGSGLVCDEPTLVAIHTDRSARRRVIAIGSAARPMLGRTPDEIEVVQPVREGRIADYEAAEAFLQRLVQRALGRSGWVGPRMVVAVPHQASDVEIRAVRDGCGSAGAREVQLVPRPIAAAVGADLPVRGPAGLLIVDVGGGATEISLLALSGVVLCRVVPGGGDGMDRGIVRWLQQERDLVVGLGSAERLKIALGTAGAPAPGDRGQIRGRCMRRGIPIALDVTADQVRTALDAKIVAIALGIRAVISDAPPELSADIVDQGVVLTGGGSHLTDLDVALRDLTHLPVVRAEAPHHAVIRGTGSLLEDASLQQAVAC